MDTSFYLAHHPSPQVVLRQRSLCHSPRSRGLWFMRVTVIWCLL